MTTRITREGLDDGPTLVSHNLRIVRLEEDKTDLEKDVSQIKKSVGEIKEIVLDTRAGVDVLGLRVARLDEDKEVQYDKIEKLRKDVAKMRRTTREQFDSLSDTTKTEILGEAQAELIMLREQKKELEKRLDKSDEGKRYWVRWAVASAFAVAMAVGAYLLGHMK